MNINYMKQAQNSEGSLINQKRLNAMVEMDENNKLAYIAGIIDGDGAIMALVEEKRVRIEIALYNSCQDVILFCKKVFKMGKVYKGKWSIKTNAGSKYVLQLIQRFLLVKYKQSLLALELINSVHMVQKKELALEISNLNIRSRKSFHVSTQTTDYYTK